MQIKQTEKCMASGELVAVFTATKFGSESYWLEQAVPMQVVAVRQPRRVSDRGYRAAWLNSHTVSDGIHVVGADGEKQTVGPRDILCTWLERDERLKVIAAYTEAEKQRNDDRKRIVLEAQARAVAAAALLGGKAVPVTFNGKTAGYVVQLELDDAEKLARNIELDRALSELAAH